MLEVLVSCRHAGEKPGKKAGDILVVKLSPAAWGTEERQVHLITYLDDPELEARMRAGGKRTAVYPYAAVGEDPETGATMITCRCTRRVNMADFAGTDGIDPAIRCDEPTRPKNKTHLRIADLVDGRAVEA